MAQPQFYYRDGEEPPRGPFLAEEMKLLAESGVITPDMSIRRGEGPWRVARSVEGLFPKVSQDLPDPVAPPREEIPKTPSHLPPGLPETPVGLPTSFDVPDTDGQLRLPTPTANRIRFPALTVLASIYLVLAGVAVLIAAGCMTLVLYSALFLGENSTPLIIAVPLAGMWLIGGFVVGAVFLTLSETCRLFLSLEKNQRLQADALSDMRAIALHRLRSEAGADAGTPRENG